MNQHLSDEVITQEPSFDKNTFKFNHLHLLIHLVLALSLAIRYFFAKSLLPYSFELDFVKTLPIQSKLSQSNFFSLEQLDLRLWPLIGFSFCLWIMIGLFNNKVKKAWIYILMIHAIPILDLFGIVGSPWTGAICCWVLALRMHIKPFKNKVLQALFLMGIGILGLWSSSLNFYLWPWLIFSYLSYLNIQSIKKWSKLSFYFYLLAYQLISIFLIHDVQPTEKLQFVFNLWPVFLGPVAFITAIGFFLLWCLKSIFRKDETSQINKELGLLCLLLASALFMNVHSTGASIEALIILAFFIPFGLLYGPFTQIEKWSVNLSYWSSLTVLVVVILIPTLKQNFSNFKFKANFVEFQSWHFNERMSQDLSLRFWEAIEVHKPQIILCDTEELALQMQRHSGKKCLPISSWVDQKDVMLEQDLQQIFILSKEPIPLKQRLEWFGPNLNWFLHKQWTLTVDLDELHTFYVYGSTEKKESPLVF